MRREYSTLESINLRVCKKYNQIYEKESNQWNAWIAIEQKAHDKAEQTRKHNKTGYNSTQPFPERFPGLTEVEMKTIPDKNTLLDENQNIRLIIYFLET